jgi:magnesium transporter
MRAEDSIEMFRDILGGLMDLYHSQVNNKMNEVMKTLTVMSSIFIPLTFIVGVYGMNFDFMPELHSHYGYIGVWLIMLAVAGGLIFYFKRKKYF